MQTKKTKVWGSVKRTKRDVGFFCLAFFFNATWTGVVDCLWLFWLFVYCVENKTEK